MSSKKVDGQEPKISSQTDGGKSEDKNKSPKNPTSTDFLYRKNVGLEKLNDLKSDLEDLYNSQSTREDELESKQRLLKPKNAVLNNSGKKLTSFARKRLNTEVVELKEEIRKIQAEIKRIEKLLTSIYRGINDKISRANVKKAAKNESYHERYKASIKERIDEFFDDLADDKVKALKAEVPKAEFKVGNAMMMKAMLNAPKFLHTRVTSNPTAREEYLGYFRGKLTGNKGKSRK